MTVTRLLLFLVVLATIFSAQNYLFAQTTSSGSIITADNVRQIEEIGRLGDGSAVDLVWSPDGKYLAVAGSIGIWLYDIPGETRRLITGHQWGVYSVAFSPDGAVLASGSDDGTIRLWSTRTFNEINRLICNYGAISEVEFSPDGAYLAAGTFVQVICLWNTRDYQQPRVLEGHQIDISALVFTPDSRHLISAAYDNTVRLWDTTTGEGSELFSTPFVIFDMTYDGELLAAGSKEGKVYLSDTLNSEEPETFDTGSQGDVHSIDQIGDLIALGDYGQIVLLDANSQTPFATLDTPGMEQIYAVAFSPDGQYLASSSTDGALRLWNIHTKDAARLPGHFTSIMEDVTFGADSATLYSSCRRGLCAWNTETGEQTAQYMISDTPPAEDNTPREGPLMLNPTGASQAIYDLSFKVDTIALISVLYADERYTTAFTWEPASGTAVGVGGFGVEDAQRIELTSDGEQIVMLLANGHIQFMNRATGAWHELQPNEEITDLALSPDDRWLAGSTHTGVVLWDMASGEEYRRMLPPPEHPFYVNSWPGSLTFSPDASLLAVEDGKSVWVWETETGELLTSYYNDDYIISDLEFNLDGTILAIPSLDRLIRLRDARTGELLITLETHTNEVHDGAFSPDGRFYASASWDGTIRLWGIKN